MNGLKGGAVCAGILFVAAVLQQALAFRLAVFGARPDFMLVALAVLGMFASRSGGMVLGFVDGLVVGAMSGANLQHYVASRTLTGLLIGWVSSAEVPRTIPAAAIAAAGVTVVAQLTLMFLAPPHSITPFLTDTIRGAVYNGVLAIPVYALLKKIVAPVVR
ncbi:MAG: hypothetical protein ACYC96_04420 [Fimbriimonadaceae bacterium]